ncbi:ADP-ribosyltransferase-containing protein [Bradyrhizobium sp. 5.13L]
MDTIADYTAWKAKQQQTSVEAANTVLTAIDGTPDEVAGDLNLASEFGKVTGNPVPPAPMVQEYRPVFQQAIEREKNRTILSSAPRLTEWLRNPENAAVARDDLQGLSWWETAIGAGQNAFSRGVRRVPQSYNQFLANSAAERAQDQMRGFTDILGDQTAIRGADGSVIAWKPIANPVDLMNAGMRFMTSRLATLTGTDEKQAAAYYQQQVGLINKRIGEIPLSPAGSEGRDYWNEAAKSGDLNSFMRVIAQHPGPFMAFVGETAAESLPSMAAAIGVGVATRSPAAAATFMGVNSAITEKGSAPADFFREKGIDISTPEGAAKAVGDPALMREAIKRGDARGLVVGLMDGLSGGVAGKALVQSHVGNMVLQAITQAAMGAAGEAGGQVASGQPISLGDILMEGFAEFAGAPVEVAGMGGGRVMEMARKAKEAGDRRAMFEALSGQAQSSVLRNRMPDKFRQFVEAATANGPVENVYVPADQFVQYFQGIGVDPHALVDELEGVSRDDLDAALAGGGDLQIPTATYAARIAGSEHDAFLMDNMRFDPDQFTAAEAQQFNERAQEAMQEAHDIAERVRVEGEQLRSFEQEIYDTMVSRLRAAGRSTDVATTEAMLYPAFYRVMAERSGLTTEEFMQRYPLPQVAGDLPEGIQYKNVDELNRTLAEARSRKAVKDTRQTLLEFIDKHGGINDVGGELKARNAETVARGKGKKSLKLARKGFVAGARDMLGGDGGKKHGPDEVARAAIEAGFLADDPVANEYRTAIAEGHEVPDIVRPLWDAIDRELRGEPQYSATDEADPAVARNAQLDEIEQYLSSLGVTLQDDDAAIRQAIEGARQYAQGGQLSFLFNGPANTESKAFKEWFGKSKVFDGEGKPMAVHHWTYNDFDTFDRMAILKKFKRDPEGIDRIGNWFSDNPDARYAAPSMGGKRMDVYLSIQKPLYFDDEDGKGGRDSFTQLNDFIKQNGGATATRNLLKDMGYDGIIMNGTKLDGYEQNVFIAFEPEQIKSVNNSGAFNPNDPRIMFQSGGPGPRGAIQFPAAGVGNGDTVIRLFQTADLSTMLHESGHYFLTVIQDMAARGEEGASADYATVKEWWGTNAADVAKDAVRVMPDVAVTAEDVKAALANGTTGDVMKDAAIDVGMQEQWARAFEGYLMDGKAPSADLRSAFEKFRAWLISVYRRLTNLNVTVSDDIRGVFDRMIASDDEIAKATAETGDAGPVFATAESMGLTDEQYSAFLKLRDQAQEDAKARLLRETMAPIKRQQEKWFKEERKAARAEVERDVNSYPVFRALEWMGNKRWLGEGQPQEMPDIRLSKDVLVERYGEGVLKTLPRGKQTVYTVEGGLDPDEAAGWFGFRSGDEMVKSLEQTLGRKAAIDAETDRVMRDRHGDALNDGEIEAHALDAIHAPDKRGMWIAAELKAVVEVAGTGKAMTMKEARATARQTIGRMRVRDAMNANRFLAAERKAADEAARLGATLAREKIWLDNARRKIGTAARAALRGEGSVDAVNEAIDANNAKFETSIASYTVPDREVVGKDGQAKTVKGGARTATSLGYNDMVAKLIDAKRRQLLNHAFYSEARKVADEVEKAERFVDKLGKASHRQRIAGAGRRENAEVDYLGAIDEVLDRYDFRQMSGAAEQRRGSLNAFVATMIAAGRENELAIPESVLTDAARKPYKTLPVEELRGVVDSLKNLEHIALRWDKLIDAQREREFSATAESIAAAIDKNLPKRPPGAVRTKGEQARNTARAYLDSVLNATTLLRAMDGFTDQGATYQAIKAPLDEAQNRLIVRKQDAARALEGLYSVYSKEERRAMAVREHMPELGFALSKWERIAVALNTGNEGNLTRLTDPRQRRPLTLDQVNSILAGLDARDADFVQSVWDYIGTFKADIAARERRATGVEPAWVEASPVTIGGKQLSGGYYPIKYDTRLSSTAADRETVDIAQSLQAGRFGKAQTRNGHLKERAAAGDGSIDLDMAVMHRHVNQVIYDLEMSEPVANAWRLIQDGRVRGALDDAGRSADFDALQAWLKDAAEGELGATSPVGSIARGLKSNFTAAKLAFNISNAVLQVTGVAQSFVVVGKRDMAIGIMRTARNPAAAAAAVAAKSPFMAARQTTFNKDVMDFYSDPRGGMTSSRLQEFKRNIWGPLSFWLMQKVQWHFADVPTWIAGYEQGLRKFGNDEAQAVAHADGLVKRAQASGLFIDRAGVERGSLSSRNRQNDIVKLFTTLGSYMFAKFNVAYERTATASRTIQNEGVSAKSAQEVASWTLDMTLLFVLEALVGAAIKGQLPGQGDGGDDESWLAWLAKNTAFSVLGTLPFIRDGVSALQGHGGGGAYGSIVEELAKPVKEAAQGQVDKALVKSIVNAAGTVTGFPSVASNRIVDAGWRQSEGESVSPLEYVFGKFKK